YRPDQKRNRYQPDPQQHVEDTQQGVALRLRSAQPGQQHPPGERQPRDRRNAADEPGVHEGRHRRRQRTGGIARIKPWPLPREGDQSEGEGQRPRRADHRKRGGHGKIARPAKAVCDDARFGHGCTWMVATVRSRWCSSTSTLPGTSTLNWNVWLAVAATSNL